MYDVILITLHGTLFIVGFVKKNTYMDFQQSSRPLIREQTGEDWVSSNYGYSELTFLSKRTTKVNEKTIDFKFRPKLESY